MKILGVIFLFGILAGCASAPKTAPKKAANDFEEQYFKTVSRSKLNAADTEKARQCYFKNKDSITFVPSDQMPTAAKLKRRLYIYSVEKKAVLADMDYWLQLESPARAQKFLLYCIGREQN